MDGHGVSFWGYPDEMRKVEESSSFEQILKREFIREYETDNHGSEVI